MPRGASPKREREYEELKEEFHEEGRYKGREEEVASRIVNKQRKQFGETKEQKRKGNPQDDHLPIDDYTNLTVDQVLSRAKKLSDGERKQIRNYEKKHRNRKTLMAGLDRIERDG